MKILLVPVMHDGKISNPIGVLSIGTILKNSNYDVEIVDFNYLYYCKIINRGNTKDKMLDEMRDYLLSKNPDIVGLSCMCNCYHVYIELAQKLKKCNPELKVFLGGPQATLTAKQSLEAFPWIDLIELGESEKNIEAVINVLLGKQNPDHVNGIAYKKNDEVIINEVIQIENLDELPLLNYDMLPYFDKMEMVELEIGRGCPFGCSFCSTKTFWKRNFRIKSVDRIFSEIDNLVKMYNKKYFNFVHDLFTVNRKIVLELCDKIINSDLNIYWGCSARLDTLDEELIVAMTKAGCVEIYIGVETGSVSMQKKINKNLNLNRIDEKIILFKKYNLRITFSFIYGFPGENAEELIETINLIGKLYNMGFDKIQLHQCSIFAGTELFTKYKDQLEYKGLLTDTVKDRKSVV